MKILKILYLVLFLLAIGLSVQARTFRSIQPIARPSAVPDGAVAVDEMQPVPRHQVEQAVQAVARAWNSGELDPLLADSFVNKSRLLDTIAEVVPRDARLTILGIQAVSTLEQYRQEDKVVSRVSAVVRSQIEFNDPITGFQRLEGTGEWYFQVEEASGTGSAPEAGMAAVIAAPERDPDAPYIENIFPSRPNWDSTLTIQGGNFGDQESFVYAVLEDMSFLLIVQSWSDTIIEARFTEDQLSEIDSRIPDFAWLQMRAVINVAWNFGSSFVGKEIVFQPTPSASPPEITEIISEYPVSPSGGPSISPGRTISLMGENFMSRPGSIVFRLNGAGIGEGRPGPEISFEGEIVSWSDSQIEVTLPASADGFTAQDGQVVVTNDSGVEGSFDSLYFAPRLETRWLENDIDIDSSGWDHPGGCEQTNAFFSGLTLRNGWQTTGSINTSKELFVKGAWYMFDQASGSIPCNVVVWREPAAGSSHPVITIECKAYNQAKCSCGVRVQIRGPAGTLPTYIEDQVWLQPPIEDLTCY